MSDERDLLVEIRDAVRAMDRRQTAQLDTLSGRLESVDRRLETVSGAIEALDRQQAAQMETLIGLVRDIHALLERVVTETLAEHTRRIATLEARMDRLETADERRS
jgi:hypothetical protein